jgi:hypothetical protein
MPIEQHGWELLITRLREDRRGTNRRTVGSYQVYHDGVKVDALAGMCVETRGPGDNSHADNNRRIEAGRYPLRTHQGPKYVTFGYKASLTGRPRPAIEVAKVAPRYAILFHPGQGFMSTVGCFNPTQELATAASTIDLADSRSRVIAVIADMENFLGAAFTDKNERPIPNAWIVVDGEPTLDR